jgi:hypothetical protein
MQCRTFFRYVIISLYTTLIAVPVFAEGSAVAGIKGKIQGVYGHAEGNEIEVISGTLTLPLCFHSGLQIDGAYGDLGEDQLKGVGLHLFTRDPQNYLLGLFGAHAELQDIDINRIGLEGELYNGPVTLASFLGYQEGDIDDTLFGTLNLNWYPIDNLMLVTGGSLTDKDDGRVHLGAEYQIVAGLSISIDFAVGENHYEHALFGLNFYFGGRKSLLKRHREDDPANAICNNVLQGLNSIQDRQRELALPM